MLYVTFWCWVTINLLLESGLNNHQIHKMVENSLGLDYCEISGQKHFMNCACATVNAVYNLYLPWVKNLPNCFVMFYLRNFVFVAGPITDCLRVWYNSCTIKQLISFFSAKSCPMHYRSIYIQCSSTTVHLFDSEYTCIL